VASKKKSAGLLFDEVLPQAQRTARSLLSLDPQEDVPASQQALEMALGFVPGIGQAMALRDIERARRANDPAAAAMAAASFVPFGRLAGLGKKAGPVMSRIDAPQDAVALENEARKISAQMRERIKADRDRGLDQVSEETLFANKADLDRVTKLMSQAQDLKNKPIKTIKRPEPEWFNYMSKEQQSTVKRLPEWDGSSGFSLRRGGESAEDDIYTSAQSNFLNSEVVPGVRSVQISDFGDLGGYSEKNEIARIKSLSNAIKESKEISPIFVGVEPSGEMFVMEGQHRIRALKSLGEKSIPAKIVVDFSE